MEATTQDEIAGKGLSPPTCHLLMMSIEVILLGVNRCHRKSFTIEFDKSNLKIKILKYVLNVSR